MDFFEEQTQARKRTIRLGVLFAIAVAGVIASVYVLSMVVFGAVALDAGGVAYIVGRYEDVSGLRAQ